MTDVVNTIDVTPNYTYEMVKHQEENQGRLTEFINRKNLGISFALLMYDEDKNTSEIFERVEQPCYGELRKYQETHDDCSKSEFKPGDLHDPFPDGIPLSVAFNLEYMYAYSETPKRLFEFVLSPNSPWWTGINKETTQIWEGDRLIGIILNDTRIDPTVLINLLKFMQNSSGQRDLFSDMVDRWMSYLDACFLQYISNIPLKVIGPANTYHSPSLDIDFERFMNLQPRNLSGKTLFEREDYNRLEMHAPYQAEDEEKGFNFFEEFAKVGELATPWGNSWKYDPDDFAGKAMKILEEAKNKYL